MDLFSVESEHGRPGEKREELGREREIGTLSSPIHSAELSGGRLLRPLDDVATPPQDPTAPIASPF